MLQYQRYGGLAQLGERSPHTRKVAGSSPVVSTTSELAPKSKPCKQSLQGLKFLLCSSSSEKRHVCFAYALASADITSTQHYHLFSGIEPESTAFKMDRLLHIVMDFAATISLGFSRLTCLPPFRNPIV